jgi:glycerate dehydrogenase
MPAKPISAKPSLSTGRVLGLRDARSRISTRRSSKRSSTCAITSAASGEVEAPARECEIAIVNKCDVDGDAIRASKRLKLIALTGTGSDNVDVAAAKQCGVAVANSRGYCTTSLAQHVFALILTLTRQIEGYAAIVRRGAWAKSGMFAMFDYPVRDLSGRTLG